MKEFMRTVKKTFQVGRGELLTYSVVSLIFGVIGIILMLIIMEVADENEYLAFGTLMVFMISIILLLFGGVFSLQQDFNLVISFGIPRKYYVPAKYLLIAANCVVCMASALLIGLFEKFFYAGLYPGAKNLFGVDFVLEHPAIIVAFVLLIPMVVMLLGAFFVKFGMKFFWVCWVLWMFTFTALPKMVTATHEEPASLWGRMGTAVIDTFSGFNEIHAVIAMVVAGVGGVVIAFLLLRKQRVTI